MAAPKSIKGITIEIDGDTTKLGKSLKSIDDQSQDLAASLKYVDKLLDFDPGNTELLAEKQKLLTDAVDNTAERLSSLKKVQDQVSRQYQSGEIGQRAYLDFQHELAKTERKLENLRSESQQVERSLDDTGDEARDTSTDLGQLGKGADGAADGLDGLGGSLGDLADAVKTTAVVGLIAGAAAKIGEIADETREYREEMAKLDIAYENANLSAEAAEIAYSKIYRVLGETDQTVEASQQIALIANNLQDVTRWASVAPGLVATFGDALQPETFYESANETLKLNEATGAFVQLLEGSGVYSVEEYERKLSSLKKKEERLAYQQMGPGAIAVDQFNDKLQSLTTTEEKQAYILEMTELLLGDAAQAYEERNQSVLDARDADREFEEAMGDVGEALQPLATGVKNMATDFVEGITPSIEACADMLVNRAAPGIVGFGDTLKGLAEDWPEHLGKMEETVDDWVTNVLGFFGVSRDAAEDLSEKTTYSFEATAGYAAAAAGGMIDSASSIPVAYAAAAQGVDMELAKMERSFHETIDKIERQRWNLPKPEIPVFGISGEFSLHPPKAPKVTVSWNAAGGIFNQPMVIPAMDGSLQGFGEAGQEAILPLSGFYNQLEQILSRQHSSTVVQMEAPQITVYQQPGEDGEALAMRVVAALTNMYESEVSAL